MIKYFGYQFPFLLTAVSCLIMIYLLDIENNDFTINESSFFSDIKQIGKIFASEKLNA